MMCRPDRQLETIMKKEIPMKRNYEAVDLREPMVALDGSNVPAGKYIVRTTVDLIPISADAGIDLNETKTLTTPDLMMIQGALDSLGVALSDHGHHWSDGERAIYERAVEVIGTAFGDPVE